nr:precorrin-6B methylase [Mastigocoleus sp. MO_167.B18]
PIQDILQVAWNYLPPHGRLVATATNLENLYAISQTFAQLQVRNIEIVQSAVNRLETRGLSQTFAALNPVFILSGEKLE